jgi:RNA polymerase sigma-70 factor (ECF subfamily)
MAAAVTVGRDTAEEDADDEALVARAVAGDEAAFGALYERWSSRVLRFACARLGDRDEAQDVVQEVFVAVLRCLPAYRGTSRFGTWLFGVAFHVVCRAQRRRRRTAWEPLAEVAERATSGATSGERRLDALRALERCATTLHERASRCQREIFRLSYGESRSATEVAQQLQRRPETVRAQLSRTRRTLLESVPGLADILDR